MQKEEWMECMLLSMVKMEFMGVVASNLIGETR